jgi:hypothetical protein
LGQPGFGFLQKGFGILSDGKRYKNQPLNKWDEISKRICRVSLQS